MIGRSTGRRDAGDSQVVINLADNYHLYHITTLALVTEVTETGDKVVYAGLFPFFLSPEARQGARAPGATLLLLRG